MCVKTLSFIKCYVNGVIYYYERMFDVPVMYVLPVWNVIQAPMFSPGIGGPDTKLMNLAELDIFSHLDE